MVPIAIEAAFIIPMDNFAWNFCSSTVILFVFLIYPEGVCFPLRKSQITCQTPNDRQCRRFIINFRVISIHSRKYCFLPSAKQQQRVKNLPPKAIQQSIFVFSQTFDIAKLQLKQTNKRPSNRESLHEEFELISSNVWLDRKWKMNKEKNTSIVKSERQQQTKQKIMKISQHFRLSLRQYNIRSTVSLLLGIDIWIYLKTPGCALPQHTISGHSFHCQSIPCICISLQIQYRPVEAQKYRRQRTAKRKTKN